MCGGASLRRDVRRPGTGNVIRDVIRDVIGDVTIDVIRDVSEGTRLGMGSSSARENHVPESRLIYTRIDFALTCVCDCARECARVSVDGWLSVDGWRVGGWLWWCVCTCVCARACVCVCVCVRARARVP